MKKLLLIIFFLFISKTLFAEIQRLDSRSFKDMEIHTMCIDGYKFVIVQEEPFKGTQAVSIVQFYEKSKNGENAVPAKC